MDIDMIPVGPELDALIAQTFELPPAPYSTSIAAAWTLVEYIISNGDEDDALFNYFYAGFQASCLEWLTPAAVLCPMICRMALASYNEAAI